MDNQTYWEMRRARELYEELETAEEAADELKRLYSVAAFETSGRIKKLIRRFALQHHLTEKEARRLLKSARTPEDIAGLLALLKADPRNADLVLELEAPAYAARLKRLEAIQKGVDIVTGGLYKKVRDKIRGTLEKIGEKTYYHGLFEMQVRSGAAFPFARIEPKDIELVLQTRWTGKNFSERLWGNTEELAAAVKEQMLLGILTGKTQREMEAAINARFNAGAYATRRLIRTEANYVANQLQLRSYAETGVDKYIYTAILDLRTSEVCRAHDKKVYPVSQARVGDNYPPLHPWCRSTTIAYMPENLLARLKQAAIDPATGETIYVPGNMTYDEWYKKYVEGGSK